MITDFYNWLISFSPHAQLGIALIIIAGVATFLVIFLRVPPEPKRIRWVISLSAAFLASMIAFAVVAIAQIVWDL